MLIVTLAMCLSSGHDPRYQLDPNFEYKIQTLEKIAASSIRPIEYFGKLSGHLNQYFMI
jgi:hypothetical protein